MKSILEEINEYRTNELKAGRTPTTIPMTYDQIIRLEAWARSIPMREIFPAQQGKNIMGMQVVHAG